MRSMAAAAGAAGCRFSYAATNALLMRSSPTRSSLSGSFGHRDPLSRSPAGRLVRRSARLKIFNAALYSRLVSLMLQNGGLKERALAGQHVLGHVEYGFSMWDAGVRSSSLCGAACGMRKHQVLPTRAMQLMFSLGRRFLWPVGVFNGFDLVGFLGLPGAPRIPLTASSWLCCREADSGRETL